MIKLFFISFNKSALLSSHFLYEANIKQLSLGKSIVVTSFIVTFLIYLFLLHPIPLLFLQMNIPIYAYLSLPVRLLSLKYIR